MPLGNRDSIGYHLITNTLGRVTGSPRCRNGVRSRPPGIKKPGPAAELSSTAELSSAAARLPTLGGVARDASGAAVRRVHGAVPAAEVEGPWRMRLGAAVPSCLPGQHTLFFFLVIFPFCFLTIIFIWILLFQITSNVLSNIWTPKRGNAPEK